MEALRRKNLAAHFEVPMLDSATPINYKSGVSVSDDAYYKDGAGAWTALAITDTFAEIGTTGLYEISLTAAEMNHDQIIIKMTGTGAANNSIVISTLPVDSNLTAIDGALTNGNNADLKLRSLSVQNPAGDAVRFVSSAAEARGLHIESDLGVALNVQSADDHAVQLLGGAAGAGLYSKGGPTGHGGLFESGATSGDGLRVQAIADGHGLHTIGFLTGNGFHSQGGASGDGVMYVGGTSGNGFSCVGGSGNTSGAAFYGGGGGSGILSQGDGVGHGVAFIKGGGVGSKDIDADQASTLAELDAFLAALHGAGAWDGSIAFASLADTSANREVIAKAMKVQDVSAFAIVAGSVMAHNPLYNKIRLQGISYDSNKNPLSMTFKEYPTAADANADTNAIAVHTVTHTYNADGTLNSRKSI